MTGTRPDGAPQTPQTPLRRTPLARLVDAAARARTSTMSLGKATLGSVVRLVALLAAMVFLVLWASPWGGRR